MAHQFVRTVDIGHHNGLHAPVEGHLPLDLPAQKAGNNGRAGMEAAHQPCGGAALADGDDGVRTDLLRGGAGGVGRSGRHGKAAPAAGLHGHALCVVDVRLRPQGDGVHGLYGLHRIFARRRFAGEHNGGGPVINGVGHIGDLRPGRPGIFHHGVQHLCGGDDRLAAGDALGDHVLLNHGNFRKVDLHAHITPGYHDSVRRVQNFGKVGNTLLIFDFGDNANGGTYGIQQGSQLPDIRRGADKAGGHKIKALFRAEENILPVLLAHVGHIQPHTGDVDTLVVFHVPVIFHPTADVHVCGLQHRQADEAVIQQNRIAVLDILRQLGIADGTAGLIA